jgi:hypothetical protein
VELRSPPGPDNPDRWPASAKRSGNLAGSQIERSVDDAWQPGVGRFSWVTRPGGGPLGEVASVLPSRRMRCARLASHRLESRVGGRDFRADRWGLDPATAAMAAVVFGNSGIPVPRLTVTLRPPCVVPADEAAYVALAEQLTAPVVMVGAESLRSRHWSSCVASAALDDLENVSIGIAESDGLGFSRRDFEPPGARRCS